MKEQNSKQIRKNSKRAS